MTKKDKGPFYNNSIVLYFIKIGLKIVFQNFLNEPVKNKNKNAQILSL